MCTGREENIGRDINYWPGELGGSGLQWKYEEKLGLGHL